MNNDPMRAFLCHAGRDWQFVAAVQGRLERYLDKIFCYEREIDPSHSFGKTIDENLRESGIFIAFVGEQLTDWQNNELDIHVRLWTPNKEERKTVIVSLTTDINDARNLPDGFPEALRTLPFIAQDDHECDPVTCARQILKILKIQSLPYDDDLPLNPQLFSYEKDIISFYVNKRKLGTGLHEEQAGDNEELELIRQKLADGCPLDWPEVIRSPGDSENRLLESEIGQYRSVDAMVQAAALMKYQKDPGLCLPEAGPRQMLYYPRSNRGLRVGILVSGGIAPGINAVIDGIVQRHWQYRRAQPHTLEILGLRNGFYAFDYLANSTSRLFPNTEAIKGERGGLATSLRANEGGSILGTSRVDELIAENTRREKLGEIAKQLAPFDILYVIGGDGSMKAAHALWSLARKTGQDRPLSVVAIPKTMDNDILWVWQSFGFLSAVQKAKEIVEQLHTESTSNPRLCVLQLFGSDSGFVVSHSVLASATGQCDVALIPEVPFSMLGLGHWLNKRICKEKRRIPHALVVLAETAIPVDALECLGDRKAKDQYQPLYDEIRKKLRLREEERDAIREFDKMRSEGLRIQGQTSDDLRRAGLSIVMDALPILLDRLPNSPPFAPQWDRLRVFAIEPRHLLRAIVPSTSDILMAQRLSILAVDNAMAGYTDFMISQWLTEFVLVPLKLVVMGRKRIPDEGIFWKSVLAKTGQPADLISPWTPPD